MEQSIKLPEFDSAKNYKYPIGFRFKPTDEELIVHYLEKRYMSIRNPFEEIIYDAHVYKETPNALADKYPSIGDNNWYFFTPRNRKYKNGTRPDRKAKNGYWSPSGGENAIVVNDKTIGSRTSLVFRELGKQSKHNSRKGNNVWMMQEYKLNQPPIIKTDSDDMKLDKWVLCHIYLNKRNAVKKQSKDGQNRVDQPQSEVYSQENTIAMGNNLAMTIRENNYVVEQIFHDRGAIKSGFGDYSISQNHRNSFVQSHVPPQLMRSSSVPNYNGGGNFDHSHLGFHGQQYNYGSIPMQQYGSVAMQSNNFYNQQHYCLVSSSMQNNNNQRDGWIPVQQNYENMNQLQCGSIPMQSNDFNNLQQDGSIHMQHHKNDQNNQQQYGLAPMMNNDTNNEHADHGSIPMQPIDFDDDYFEREFSILGCNFDVGPCDLKAIEHLDFTPFVD